MKTYFLFFLIMLTKNVKASICDSIFRSSNVGCNDLSTSHSSGGSYPLLFDAFNFSPSALPTLPTPIGVEGYYNESKLNVSLIKGAEDVGFGASMKNTDTTFFSGVENYKVALKKNGLNGYTPSSLDENFTLGSALNFLNIPDAFSLPFGLNYRINAHKKIYSLQPGLEFRTSWLTVGASTYTEKPPRYNDGFYDVQEIRKNYSLSAGLHLGFMLVDYSLLFQSNTSLYYQGNSVVSAVSNNYTTKTQIVSGTMVYNSLSATAAYRTQDDSRLTGNYSSSNISGRLHYRRSHFLMGAAYKTERLEMGAFYNYVLNEDTSLLVKIFF